MLTFLFVVSRIISKSFLFFLRISNVVLPIEPVDPRIAIFFFIKLKIYKHSNTKWDGKNNTI